MRDRNAWAGAGATAELGRGLDLYSTVDTIFFQTKRLYLFIRLCYTKNVVISVCTGYYKSNGAGAVKLRRRTVLIEKVRFFFIL